MYFTILEFSKKYGIQKEYILENLYTVFSNYIVKEKGIIMLDERAIEAVNKTSTERKEDRIEKQEEVKRQTDKENIELIRAREEIDRLKAELAEEKESKKETEKRLLDMMEKVLELTDNAQKLTAMVNRNLLLDDGRNKRDKGFFSKLLKIRRKPLP